MVEYCLKCELESTRRSVAPLIRILHPSNFVRLNDNRRVIEAAPLYVGVRQ